MKNPVTSHFFKQVSKQNVSKSTQKINNMPKRIISKEVIPVPVKTQQCTKSNKSGKTKNEQIAFLEQRKRRFVKQDDPVMIPQPHHQSNFSIRPPLNDFHHQHQHYNHWKPKHQTYQWTANQKY